MNREKQIQELAKGISNKSITNKGITYLQAIEAMKLADRTMIERVCQWLYTIDFDSQTFRDCDETFNNDLFIDTLCKVMKE